MGTLCGQLLLQIYADYFGHGQKINKMCIWFGILDIILRLFLSLFQGCLLM